MIYIECPIYSAEGESLDSIAVTGKCIGILYSTWREAEGRDKIRWGWMLFDGERSVSQEGEYSLRETADADMRHALRDLAALRGVQGRKAEVFQ